MKTVPQAQFEAVAGRRLLKQLMQGRCTQLRHQYFVLQYMRFLCFLHLVFVE